MQKGIYLALLKRKFLKCYEIVFLLLSFNVFTTAPVVSS